MSDDQQEKVPRATTFEELEEAFYGLVQKHNELLQSHRRLERRVEWFLDMQGDYFGMGK